MLLPMINDIKMKLVKYFVIIDILMINNYTAFTLVYFFSF